MVKEDITRGKNIIITREARVKALIIVRMVQGHPHHEHEDRLHEAAGRGEKNGAEDELSKNRISLAGS